MSSVLDILIEMGFDKQKAELAIQKTGSDQLDIITEWLITHENDSVEVDVVTNTEDIQPAASSCTPEENAENASNTTTPSAKSIQCDDCGKLFKTQEEVEFHASKSGHENFSESTEEKKPLTEEEKKEQLAKIEAKLRQRRLEREAREKQEALQKEKNRIKSGKELLEAKKKHDELEMKKIVEQRKREKEEERLAKERVREQIEQDKLARKAKFGNPGVTEAPTASTTNPQPQVTPKPSNQTFSEVKLQIRLPNGSSLLETFGAKEPLSAVRLFIEMKAKDEQEGPFNLMTNFPKKIFGTEDYDKPLESLGLAPSATIFVNRAKPSFV